jgi:hypothetical protein
MDHDCFCLKEDKTAIGDEELLRQDKADGIRCDCSCLHMVLGVSR